jgi:prefoldin beta subunit
MAEEKLSPQLQDQINRFQQFRTQMEILIQQRQQVELQLKETDQAIEEISKAAEGTPIFKSIGSILIKAKGKNEMAKELKSAKETLELRKTTLEKQEGRTKEKLTELQSKVQNALNVSKQES